MLRPAKLYANELTQLIGETATNPEYKWWHGSNAVSIIEIDDTFWAKIQLVKLNKDNRIIGYYKAAFARPENYIESLSCINFNLKDKMTFAIGMKEFLCYLVNELCVPKIKWSVYVGNPMEKAYDKFCKKHGGRIIGIEDYNILINNKMYGCKYYQWLSGEWREQL